MWGNRPSSENPTLKIRQRRNGSIGMSLPFAMFVIDWSMNPAMGYFVDFGEKASLRMFVR
jgi:hypothetical protein